jgi:hypothetical protein
MEGKYYSEKKYDTFLKPVENKGVIFVMTNP